MKQVNMKHEHGCPRRPGAWKTLHILVMFCQDCPIWGSVRHIFMDLRGCAGYASNLEIPQNCDVFLHVKLPKNEEQ